MTNETGPIFFIQRRFVYSITAPTGSGKTAVALLLAAYVALSLHLIAAQSSFLFGLDTVVIDLSCRFV